VNRGSRHFLYYAIRDLFAGFGFRFLSNGFPIVVTLQAHDDAVDHEGEGNDRYKDNRTYHQEQLDGHQDAIDATLPQINILIKKGEKGQAKTLIEKTIRQIETVEANYKRLGQMSNALRGCQNRHRKDGNRQMSARKQRDRERRFAVRL